ncbi:MAG: alkaline phosphatase family protein [Chloroflexota bacterium]
MIKINPSFVKPGYGGHCFAEIPQTIQYLLTGGGQPALSPTLFGDLPQQYQRIIFFFVDAFGWRFFTQHADRYPFLKRFQDEGQVSKITSQFPSTTAAHVTSIHTGLPVGQSGIYEWAYYEPSLDTFISPLLFSYAGTMERNTLAQDGIDPQSILPSETFYQQLAKANVHSTIYQSSLYTPSPYSDIVFRGADVFAYRTFTEALVNLRQAVITGPKPAYDFLYYSNIDSICHKHGPNSPEVEAEIDVFMTMMERIFFQEVVGKLKDTLLIVTADHGQVEVSDETLVNLKEDARFAGLERYLKHMKHDEPMIPAGSSRDLFMHVHDETLDQAQTFLAERLTDVAEVYKVSDLIEQGYFGPSPVSEALLSRIGNLVVLPYRYHSVWWFDSATYNVQFRGHHGGVTPQEMEIPFLLYSFS